MLKCEPYYHNRTWICAPGLNCAAWYYNFKLRAYFTPPAVLSIVFLRAEVGRQKRRRVKGDKRTNYKLQGTNNSAFVHSIHFVHPVLFYFG